MSNQQSTLDNQHWLSHATLTTTPNTQESNSPIQPAEPSVAVNQPLYSSHVSSQVYSYHQPYSPPASNFPMEYLGENPSAPLMRYPTNTYREHYPTQSNYPSNYPSTQHSILLKRVWEIRIMLKVCYWFMGMLSLQISI